MDVFPESEKLFSALDSILTKPALPECAFETQLLSRAISKATLDQLHGAFNGLAFTQRDLRMKVVRHHHKVVQPVFALITIVKHNLDQQHLLAITL